MGPMVCSVGVIRGGASARGEDLPPGSLMGTGGGMKEAYDHSRDRV